MSGEDVTATEREVSKADPADCSRCEWDCQCARCGSSVGWEDCSVDASFGFYGDERDPDCRGCGGTGITYFCLSSAEWCVAHPQPGREGVQRHNVEWFVSVPCKAHQQGSAQDEADMLYGPGRT